MIAAATYISPSWEAGGNMADRRGINTIVAGGRAE
jgi:hypothetical protein